VLVEHLLDHPAAVFRFGDVALVDGRSPGAVEVALELLYEQLCVVPVSAVSSGDGRALAGQAPADRRADPTGPSGDQGNSTRELLTDYSGGLFDDGCADVVNEVPPRRMFIR
jgi:hypothetical protein